MRVCLGDQVCTVILPSYTQLEGATQRMTVTQMPFSTALLIWAWCVLSSDWIFNFKPTKLGKDGLLQNPQFTEESIGCQGRGGSRCPS